LDPGDAAVPLENVLVTHSPDETLDLGAGIGRVLGPGDVLALVGELGAGKTVLAKGVLKGLGGDPDQVTSPTFVLMARHQAHLTLYHFDAYRLSGPAELLDLGAEEAFYSDAASLVEWADRVMAALPADRLEVHMTILGPTDREIRLRPTGPRSRGLVRRLSTQTADPHEAEGAEGRNIRKSRNAG